MSAGFLGEVKVVIRFEMALKPKGMFCFRHACFAQYNFKPQQGIAKGSAHQQVITGLGATAVDATTGWQATYGGDGDGYA